MAQAIGFQVRRGSKRPNPAATSRQFVDALSIAEQQGLMSGGRTLTVRGRMPSLLVEQAKKKTGIQSDSKLIEAALANIVAPGCGQKPSGKPDISSTNTPSVSVTTGKSIGSPADLPVISNSIPLRTIRSLSAGSPADADNALVRLRGTVLDEQPGEFIVIHDLTGTIFAETRQAVLPKVKELVEQGAVVLGPQT